MFTPCISLLDPLPYLSFFAYASSHSFSLPFQLSFTPNNSFFPSVFSSLLLCPLLLCHCVSALYFGVSYEIQLLLSHCSLQCCCCCCWMFKRMQTLHALVVFAYNLYGGGHFHASSFMHTFSFSESQFCIIYRGLLFFEGLYVVVDIRGQWQMNKHATLRK